MKFYIFLFLLSITSFSYGQSVPIHPHREVAYFVDSVRVSATFMEYIKPDSIIDVVVSKDFVDKENNVFGAIYIATKTPKAYKFIGLEEIKKVYGIVAPSLTIYMLDKEFIQDTQYFNFPSSWIFNVILIKGAAFDNLKNSFPDFSIVKIITKSNAPKPSGIMIRGAASKE